MSRSQPTSSPTPCHWCRRTFSTESRLIRHLPIHPSDPKSSKDRESYLLGACTWCNNAVFLDTGSAPRNEHKRLYCPVANPETRELHEGWHWEKHGEVEIPVRDDRTAPPPPPSGIAAHLFSFQAQPASVSISAAPASRLSAFTPTSRPSASTVAPPLSPPRASRVPEAHLVDPFATVRRSDGALGNLTFDRWLRPINRDD